MFESADEIDILLKFFGLILFGINFTLSVL